MDRGAWQATVHGVAGVGHNLATKERKRNICRMFAVSGTLSFTFHLEFYLRNCYYSTILTPWMLCSPFNEKDENISWFCFGVTEIGREFKETFWVLRTMEKWVQKMQRCKMSSFQWWLWNRPVNWLWYFTHPVLVSLLLRSLPLASADSCWPCLDLQHVASSYPLLRRCLLGHLHSCHGDQRNSRFFGHLEK